jgi:hypothetical protein
MAKEKMDIERKKCMTPEFRASFPHLFEAKSFEDQPPKFSIVMLFPKNVDLKELKRAVFNAATEKWGAKEKWPKNLRMPFRDGEEKSDLQGYAGHTFVSASSKASNQPQVIGNKKIDGQFPRLTNEAEFYAGCYARATLIAFAYEKMGNKGVSFSLQNVQKLRDGEAFSGRKNADDEFEEVEDGSDNAENYGGDEAQATDLGF